MIIRDKQDLRKCVKQCVRRAQVIETLAYSGIYQGEFGVAANLRDWSHESASLQESFEQVRTGTPLSRQPARLLAALDALHLPIHDLDKAERIIKGYEQPAYLDAALNSMRARKVLVSVPIQDHDDLGFDERLSPLLMIDESLFTPGRYGVDYEERARFIQEALLAVNSKDILAQGCSIQALKYCLIPVCEDTGTVLHMHVGSEQELHMVADLLRTHVNVNAIVNTEETLEKELIKAAASLPNLMVQLHSPNSIPAALSVLGTRFIPFASCADTVEEMLGQWVYAKEALWQALYDAYILLARTGYELTREAIEADIETLLCRNYETLHK